VSKSKKVFLHVGCGSKTNSQTTKGFNQEGWQELRLDINPDVKPDLLGSMVDMKQVKDASVDAIFSSHNIEHLYPHEVALAIQEFKRVLKPDGILVLTCPDLQSICALVAEDKLTEPAYTSPAGPVSPVDMIYGYRPSLLAGHLFMAHRCGFTEKVLVATFRQGGFRSVASAKRKQPFFDLWMVAALDDRTEAQMADLVKEHFPFASTTVSASSNN
jgi:predicted SAM-dependent methyltransferase